MRSKLRILAIAAGVLLILLVVLPLLLPVNQFRPVVEEKISAALGRKAQVGNLSLSLLSGSLGAEDLSIADDPRFSSSPFLTAKSLKVGVEMIPLILSRSLRVTSLTIQEPEVTLLRDAAGRWNFSSLGAPPSHKAASSRSGGKPADFQVQKLELRDGRIVLGKAGSSKRSRYDNVNVEALNVSTASEFPVKASASLPGKGTFALDGRVGPLNQQDASFSPLETKISIRGFDLASSGVIDASAGLAGLMDLDAALASKNGAAETRGTIKLSKLLLVAGGSPSAVPATVDFSLKSDLRNDSGVLHPSTVKVGSATARISGNYKTRSDATVVSLKLNGQDMPARDLQAFLAALAIHMPKGASLESGTLAADLHIEGPTNRLITTGSMGLYKARLAGFDMGSKFAAISALAGVHTGSDLDIEKLTSNIRMAPDGLRADNLNLVVPSLGTLVGAGTVDAKNNLDFKMLATLASSVSPAGASGATGAAGGLGGLLGGILGGGKGSSQGQRIPFLIQGTASDPRFLPDVGGLAREMLKGQFSELNSRTQSNQQQQPNDNPLSGLGNLFKKKKP